MIVQKRRIVLLLLIVACGLTSCSSVFMSDAYYNGQEPVKDNFALVFASTTADVPLGGALYTFIYLENVHTRRTINLEKRTCFITKDTPGMGGFLTQAILDANPKKDQIRIKNTCGSLIVGEIESGEYELKRLVINNTFGKGGIVMTMTYTPPIKQTFTINNHEILYLGHIHTNIFGMRENNTIDSASILMNDNYPYDSSVFKQTYKNLEDSLIQNHTLILGEKMFTRQDRKRY